MAKKKILIGEYDVDGKSAHIPPTVDDEIIVPNGKTVVLKDSLTGKIAIEDLPDSLIINVSNTYSEAEMLALDVQIGDISKRLDVNKTFILHASPPSQLSNWTEIVCHYTHNHDTLYEPKNTAIVTHINQQHAPANAQKNSDILKSEIENVLIGSLTSHTHTPATIGAIALSARAEINGVASLDSNGKIPVGQLPNSVMEYKGNFDPNAAHGITDSTGNAGDVYISTADGSTDFGSGSITFVTGDWAVHNGTKFEKSINSFSSSVPLSNETPLALNVTPGSGTGLTAAREDHVHPLPVHNSSEILDDSGIPIVFDLINGPITPGGGPDPVTVRDQIINLFGILLIAANSVPFPMFLTSSWYGEITNNLEILNYNQPSGYYTTMFLVDTGHKALCKTPPTSDITFNIKRSINSNPATIIGTILFEAGNNEGIINVIVDEDNYIIVPAHTKITVESTADSDIEDIHITLEGYCRPDAEYGFFEGMFEEE